MSVLDVIEFKSRSAALLPIKPKYVEKILSGEKTVEFRKVEFKENIENIIIYSSSPVMLVVAVCDVVMVVKRSPYTLWKKYRDVGGIEYAEYKDYFKGKDLGVAIELSNVKVLEHPLLLQDVVDVKSPPQSFMYVDSITVAEVQERIFSEYCCA